MMDARTRYQKKTAEFPSLKTVMMSPAHFIAFGFGSGLIRPAPGTWGSLVGVLLCIPALSLSPLMITLIAFGWFVIGMWSSHYSMKALGVHDHGGIVIDEIAGIWTAFALLSWMFPVQTLNGIEVWYVMGGIFLLFRLYDIWKPFPIRQLDARLHGALGVMVDDLLAGVFAFSTLAVLVVGFIMIAMSEVGGAFTH
ncbi:MAG: phosphatidylglycerophosphatase A [Alcaligenaceae bacterium]|nr:phosphatidylglycerophosphatase A [Alcaligenaceae bacterium]